MSRWHGSATRPETCAFLRLHLYCDADFAGCQTTNRCTSGVFMAIEGPNNFFPVGHECKKQHVTSNSTTEAESCSGAFGMRQVGLPGMILWSVIQGHDIRNGVEETGLSGLTSQSGEAQIYRGQTGRQLTPNEVLLSRNVPPPVDADALNQLEHILYWHGDNQASVAICHSGLNPNRCVTWGARTA